MSSAPRLLAAIAIVFLPVAAAADAPALLPGTWETRSVPVEVTIPGVPGFLLGMAKKTRTTSRCVTPQEAAGGIGALLTPKNAKDCTVEKRETADGRVTQTYLCRQKDGRPLRATLTGRYDQASFTGRFEMAGETKKGALKIVADQTSRRVAPSCRK